MHVIEAMSALAQPTRLEVFTQLARSRPDGLSSGALAERIGTLPNTMSTHLAILSRAGLVSTTKVGRQVVYRAEPDAIRDLALFLMHDCCPGCIEVTDPAEHPNCCCSDRVTATLGDAPIS